MLLGSCEGIESKQGRRPLWRVLRRRSGVDADPSPYRPTLSNCVHFAQYLLYLEPSPDTLQTDPSPISLVSHPVRTSPASRAC
ncbi:hypothetical protein MDA_GLEAN10004441 [Myotis davidii]|uniref:Uncharacterized protein n=1 Tax=Myotis davidii TaxID=225400 RepID=L5LZZ4_MYODS|nr:hypothetical protein MDA_GLEAN10004441 [Myotis davidii]